MKKQFFSFVAIAALAFVSCKEEEKPTPADPGMATISGTITAPIDESNDTTNAGGYIYNYMPEFAPAGTMVHFIIDSEDLDPNPDYSYDYQELRYSTEIGTDGSYSMEVPAINQGVSVTVVFDEFNADHREYYGPQPDSVIVNQERFFLGDASIYVYEGKTYVRNYTYNY